MNYTVKIGICLVLLGFLFSCEKDKDFPDEPILTVREFKRISPATALWRIGFTDGDGDIGVEERDPNTNFKITIYSVKNGVDSALQGQGYRIPIVENIRTAAGVEGEFRFDLEGLDGFKLIPGVQIDSIYYEGYVLDRSGNQSNIIRTPIIEV